MKLVVEIDELTYKDIKKGKIYSSIRDVPLESVNAIANGTPLPKGHEWIPVSEGLPEDYKTVIASVDHGHVYPEARYSKENGWEWAYEAGANYWPEIEDDVVAWMPLPEPYKGEEE